MRAACELREFLMVRRLRNSRLTDENQMERLNSEVGNKIRTNQCKEQVEAIAGPLRRWVSRGTYKATAKP